MYNVRYYLATKLNFLLIVTVFRWNYDSGTRLAGTTGYYIYHSYELIPIRSENLK